MSYKLFEERLEQFLITTPCIIIHGENLSDNFLYQDNEDIIITDFKEYLTNILRKIGYRKIYTTYPLGKLKEIHTNEEIECDTLYDLATNIEDILRNSDIPSCIIVQHAGKILQASSLFGNETDMFFYRIYLTTFKTRINLNNKNIAINNAIIFLTENLQYIPQWFYSTNIKNLRTPDTSLEEKEKLVNFIVKDETDYNLLKEKIKYLNSNKEIINTFRIFSIYKDVKYVDKYLGYDKNFWTKINKDTISKLRDELERNIFGQEQAINKIIVTLKISKYNLSNIQYGSKNKPKGILLFAGPTGVGKTEVVRVTARTLFGTSDNIAIFDMSEFAHDHTVYRLIGSPPGYVGYSDEPELIKKLKNKDYSILLFDEIEKAHPKIFDIFLQILEEGRITLSNGVILDLSNYLIVFTSNLGSHLQKQDEIINYIEKYFTSTIHRPELLNRIGKNNIIVFNRITEQVTVKIIHKMLDKIVNSIKEEYKINVVFLDNVINKIEDTILKSKIHETYGGRGIGHMIEKVVIVPLTNILFENDETLKQINQIVIKEIKEENGEIEYVYILN